MTAPQREPMALDDLWIALTTIPRPTREIPFPRCYPGTETPVGSVLMWPLTQEEQMAANGEADRWTKKLLHDVQKKDEQNLGYQHTYTNEVAIQVLVRACRSMKDSARPAFPSANQMREAFTTDEIGVLFSEYCTVQVELGPIRAHMSKEESDALIVRLAQGGSTFPLDLLSLEQQRSQVLSMASQLVSCWTAMSSAGLQPDVSSFVLTHLLETQNGSAVASGDAGEPPESTLDDSEP